MTPKPGDQIVDAKDRPLVTTGSGDVFKDIGLKAPTIGDLVDFTDNSNVKWRGALVDIRPMVTLVNGMMIRQDQIHEISDHGIRREAGLMPVERWGFVAIVAQPQTVAVRLDHMQVVDDGWWPRNLPRITKQRRVRRPRAPRS